MEARILNRKEYKFEMKKLYDLLEMTIGTALTAVAFGMFIIPQNYAAAGVTGFSEILIQWIPCSLSIMVLLINVFFLLLGFFFLGWEFTAKTIVVSFTFPVFLEIFSKFPVMNSKNPLVTVLLAGVILGIGGGMTIRSGASSGGFGVLAVILNKKRKVSISLAMNLCDAIVILIQAMRQPFLQTIYGILVITISAYVVGIVVGLRVQPDSGKKSGVFLKKLAI